MKTFTFDQRIILENRIIVQAENAEEAYEKALERWDSEVKYNSIDFIFLDEETLDYELKEVE